MPLLEEYSLKDKVALIAGDGGGSTPVLAEALAEAGAKVFLMAQSHPVLDQAIEKITGRGGEAFGVVADGTDQREVESSLDTLIARWTRVDILVTNFRSEFGKPFQEVTIQEWEEVMARNLRPVFLLCNSVGKRMLHQRGGRIVNIISGLAERGLWNSAAFCASQGAVLQLTRALALEWARHNVRVNAIGTGWFSLEEQPREEAEKELLVRYIPLRRKGHPRDIAPLLVYLCSDACDYTTGQPIYVDGGLMAHP